VGRPTTVNLREIVNALLYLNRTGCPSRLLPIDFPSWNTVRSYFDAWTLDFTFLQINDALRVGARQRVGRESEPSAGIIDRKTCEDDRSRRRPRLRWGKKGDGSQAAHPG
jgi:putative transposase